MVDRKPEAVLRAVAPVPLRVPVAAVVAVILVAGTAVVLANTWSTEITVVFG